MSNFSDAIFDIKLCTLSYVKYWKLFALDEPPFSRLTIMDFYTTLKSIPLINGLYWSDFLPEGNPITNWDEWINEAAQFLSDPDNNLSNMEVNDNDWIDVNKNNIAYDVVPKAHLIVAANMDLCAVYDDVWPMVLRNLRSMPKLSAAYAKDAPAYNISFPLPETFNPLDIKKMSP